MTSAGLQTIIKSYLKQGMPLKDLYPKVSVHINDTHPAVAPAELVRILIDDYGLEWDEALITHNDDYFLLEDLPAYIESQNKIDLFIS